MKKFAIACAVVLAATLASCGDTNYCYEITATFPTLTGGTRSEVVYVWGTSNDIDAVEEKLKATYTAMGIPKDAITFTRKRTSKSQGDCHQ